MFRGKKIPPYKYLQNHGRLLQVYTTCFPKYCNIKEQVSLSCTLNAQWERGKVCDSLSRHTDRIKYGAFCSNVALNKDN